jgi:hypothetical protein
VKKFLTLGAIAVAVAFGTIGTANASVHHAHPLTMAQRIAHSQAIAKAIHDQGDFFYIRNQNGNHIGVGYIFCGAGENVVQKSQPGYTLMDESYVTNDPEGFPEFRIQYNDCGTYMAATAGCVSTIQRSLPSGVGTVWIYYTAPNDNFYLVPRLCVPDNEYDIQLGSNNVSGPTWRVTSDINYYRALILQAP